MIIDIKVPDLGESIREVEIGEWAVTVGDTVAVDGVVVDIESEKATVEVPAPKSGVLIEILKQQGEIAIVGEVIGRIDIDLSAKIEGAVASAQTVASPQAPEKDSPIIMPSAKRIMAQNELKTEQVEGSGPGGRILKEDAIAGVQRKQQTAAGNVREASTELGDLSSEVRRVPMSPLRRTIAERLLHAKQNMAILTTFNEVDMTEVKKLRTQLGEQFQQTHNVRLGFMSFFVKAAVAALKDYPLVNAQIEDADIVYRDYCDIGVAIGGGKGLVVPVLRHADRMNFAQIEHHISDYGNRAKANTLTMDELQGGTFTISNGGVYGSMLSTPIVNPPQSAILGLHAIKDRAVVVDGEIVVRPIMYVALSYDHRIIDGREAVGFLKSVKERIENPSKMLLEI